MNVSDISAIRLAPWIIRGLLGVLLCLGSEILLWNDPTAHSVWEWCVRLAGYGALAVLMLDLAARYRIRDVYHALTLAGIYGLCAGLLITPDTALVDFPRTLISRVMGGQVLLGFEMFGLFLVLTGGRSARYRRLLLGFCLWVGFYWGVWVRWSPELSERLSASASLTTMLVYASPLLLAALGLFALLKRPGMSEPLTPRDMRLTPLQWMGLLAVLLGLFILRAAQGSITADALSAIALLLALCTGILWSQHSDKGAALLDAHLPPALLAWGWIAAALLIFAGATAFAYDLALVPIEGVNQYVLMDFGFVAFGSSWLPLVAMVLGVRTIDRQSRTRPF